MADTPMMLSRRAVIRTMVGAGGGMILGFHVPGAVAAVVAPKPWTTPTDGVEINAWLAIDADGSVTVRVPHTEQRSGCAHIHRNDDRGRARRAVGKNPSRLRRYEPSCQRWP